MVQNVGHISQMEESFEIKFLKTAKDCSMRETRNRSKAFIYLVAPLLPGIYYKERVPILQRERILKKALKYCTMGRCFVKAEVKPGQAELPSTGRAGEEVIISYWCCQSYMIGIATN